MDTGGAMVGAAPVGSRDSQPLGAVPAPARALCPDRRGRRLVQETHAQHNKTPTRSALARLPHRRLSTTSVVLACARDARGGCHTKPSSCFRQELGTPHSDPKARAAGRPRDRTGRLPRAGRAPARR
jgi:hypothetical protein